jgi:hypothetical protein
MKPTVYVETSVVSACSDPSDHAVSQAQRILTIEWWQQQRPYFDLFYSQAVVAELTRVDFPGRLEAIALLDDMTMLPITPAVEGAAEAYRRHLVMPSEDMGDAVHLAVACVHEVDYLLTWNCRHLANTNKIRHIRTVNMRLGLCTPELLTPEMLVGEEGP